jgi:hypothetical protein
MKQYYLTHYALSSGIKIIRGIKDNKRDCWVKEPEDPKYLMRNFKMWSMLTDCHETPEKALARAELMRTRAIKSLENQIKRLKKLNFKNQLKQQINEQKNFN